MGFLELLYFMFKIIVFIPICLMYYLLLLLIAPFMIPTALYEELFKQEDDEDND